MKYLKYHRPETQVVDWEPESLLLNDSLNGSGADMPIEDLVISF